MNTIITIGRQFGSGGREIGEMLAKNYGIKCYDKELLSKINDAIEGIKKSERRSIMEKVVARLWKNL